jgi:energy-coupling factor transporter ATP-binding protein EcfA2
MKMTKLKIKNILGIKEYSSNGASLEITGTNGTGKTSIIHAIRYALENKKLRDFIVRNGETEGEVYIETDSGLAITRKERTGQAPYKSIKENGQEVQSPEAFLRELFSEIQLNPVEFIDMDAKEQNRIILDLIDFKWDLNWIREQFGEIVPGVDYEQNILAVLEAIQAEDGWYFTQRQDINRDVRNKKAFIEEIAASLPENYNAAKWETVNLGALYKEIETIRSRNQAIERARRIVEGHSGKIRQFEADRQIAVNALERETAGQRERLNKEIEALRARIKACETELSGLEEKRQDKLAVINAQFKSDCAAIEAQVAEHKELAEKSETDCSKQVQEAEHVERMKAHIMEYRRMVTLQTDVERLIEESDKLTAKIERARALPAEILQECKLPIDGLTIKDGRALINGLPVSNLSEGEKLDLCVAVATQKKNSLQLVLIDGIERLSTENRKRLYKKCRAAGIQFIATRTTDEPEMSVMSL